MQNNAQSQVLI